MAYLELVRSGGRTYVYLNKYVGEQQYSSKREKRILGLGRAEKALMELKIWQIDPTKIPIEVNAKNHERIPKWIDTIKNRAAY